MPVVRPNVRLGRWSVIVPVVLVAVTGGVIAVAQLLPNLDNAVRFLASAAMALLATFLFSLWATAVLIRRRAGRWMGVAGGILIVCLGWGLAGWTFFRYFRFTGVTGNIVPTGVALRSAPKQDALLPVEHAASPQPGTPREHGDSPEGDVPPDPSANGPTANDPSADGANSESAAAAVRSGEWSQFFGPQRDGIVPGVQLAGDWNAQPPELRWRRPIGAGWSSFAVRDGVAFTQEQRGALELITAYDLQTGDLRVLDQFEDRYDSVVAGDGPRATPAIQGDFLVAAGSNARLACVNLRDGTRQWEHLLVAEHRATVPQWGYSVSPLIVDDLAIALAGGPNGHSLVAYDLRTGALRWRSGNDAASYASPMLCSLAGRRQVVAVSQHGVAGHDPATGAVLWRHGWLGEEPKVPQPSALADNLLFICAGYGVGWQLLEISPGTPFAATRLGGGTELRPKFSNPVLLDGLVYGLDDGRVLLCLDPQSGEVLWRERVDYGHAQFIAAGRELLVAAETGEIVRVAVGPDGLQERGRFTAFAGKTWNVPVLTGDLLLVRNDQEIACYRLQVEPAAAVAAE